MPISPGTRLGQYEVVECVGVGGMGEVYRARDTKLDRDVAIKVLPEAFSQDKERLERFEREARLLAQLNHPNIATLHGLEEHEGQQCIIMELVEGETLAERIAKGPLSVKEATSLFTQIADGLEAAHEKGIVHRDLKPANIKITPEGRIKILDFGLAKAFSLEDSVSAAASQSPTLTKRTALGAIMGTASYMSPEQARGKSVDKRTDVWAFGCCLYEALTAQCVFEGETTTDVLSAVLSREPNWAGLPAGTPRNIGRLLRRSLEKDQYRRLRDIGDVGIELRDVSQSPEHAPDSVGTPGIWRRILSSAAIFVAGALAFWTFSRPTPPSAPPPTRFVIDLSSHHVDPLRGSMIALSPDGRRLVYVADDQLYLRDLSALVARPIPGTDGAYSPFFSPDGETVAYFTDNNLKKVSLRGGASETVATVSNAFQGIWTTAGDIVFTIEGPTGILRVPATRRGTPERLTQLGEGEVDHSYVTAVGPNSDFILFGIQNDATGDWDNAQVVIQSLATGQRKVLFEGGQGGHYAPTGHLVYGRAGTLLAVPVDLAEAELKGTPLAVVEGVMHGAGGPQFHFAENGTLAYIPAQAGGQMRSLVWVDRRGVEEELLLAPAEYKLPRLSPDGKHLAVGVVDADLNADIRVFDLERQTLTRRLTTFTGEDISPVWTPDGRRIYYKSLRSRTKISSALVYSPTETSVQVVDIERV